MDNSPLNERNGLKISWTIENFVLHDITPYGGLHSPAVSVEFDGSITEWRLGITNTVEFLQIERLNDKGPDRISVGLEVSCILADQEDLSVYHANIEFSKNSKFRVISADDFHKFLRFTPLSSPNSCLNLQCQLWSSSSYLHPLTEYAALTHFEQKQILCQKNVSLSALHRESLGFSSSENNDDLITLLIEEFGDTEVLSVVFKFKEAGLAVLRALCTLSVFDSNGATLVEGRATAYSQKILREYDFTGAVDLEVLKTKTAHLGDIIPLHFKFDFDSGNEYSSVIALRNVQPKAVIPETNTPMSASDALPQDLKALYTDGKFTDIVLEVGRETFHAHKAILCARSPVFTAMFSNEMAEKKSGVIKIDDVDPMIFEKFLLFMYTGVVNDLDEKAMMTLYSIADKYQVISLKEKCVSHLRSAISAQNFFLILPFADFHEEEHLKVAAQEFVCCQHRSIFPSQEWKHFVTTHSALASEIFQKLSVNYHYYLHQKVRLN